MTMQLTIHDEDHDRRRFIGGSDIAGILGISPWSTPADIWLRKVRADDEPTDDGRNAAAKRRGSVLERYVLDAAEQDYGLRLVSRGARYVDQDMPHFAAEIDAETADANVEVKTVHPFAAGDWLNAGDGVPVHYLAQVQWGLGVRKKPRAIVIALVGDDLRRYDIERDDETISGMRERAAHFWERYVLPRERPPLDFERPEDSINVLRKLYPGTDGRRIAADDSLEAWRRVLDESIAKAKQYEQAAEAAKAHMLEAMGSAALLSFADGRALRRKVITKKAYSVEYPASSYVDVRIVKDSPTNDKDDT